MYAMQRANGDWFALNKLDGLHVPVFSSNSEAMQARAFNIEMLVFRPVLLDERAVRELGSANNEHATHFWLVQQGSKSMKRGMILKHAELERLIRGG